MSDITLTASIRANLLSLQNTTKLLDTTSTRLSTGKRVNSALDNPNSFFTARGLSNRANDLTSRKDSIGQSISLLQATDKSIDSITALVEQAKAVAQQAQEAATSGVSTISSQAAQLTGITTVSTETAATAAGSVTAISSGTAAAATGSVTTISSETTQQPRGATLASNVTAAAASVAEVETITLTGDYEAGDTITIQLDSETADVYTITAGDVANNTTTNLTAIASAVANAINLGSGATASVGAAASGAVITLTADNVNSSFTTTVDAANDVSVIESIATASGGQTGSSLLTSASTFAATAGDILTFEVLADGVSQASTNFKITATSTIDDLLTAVSALDTNLTATFNTVSGEIEITSSAGGLELEITNTADVTVAANVTAAGAATEEVETITLNNNYVAGEAIAISIDGENADVYTVTANDIGANATATQALVATAVANALNQASSFASSISSVGASASGAVITLTHNTVNTGFTTAVTSIGGAVAGDVTAAGAATEEVETITLAGAYAVGDVISIDIDGAGADTYTVTAGDLAGNTTANLTAIATAVTAVLNAGNADSISSIAATSSGAVITLTHETVNTAFTTAFSVTEVVGSPQDEFQFSSGSGILVSGTAQTFDTTGGASDLVSKAFGATAADTLTFTVTGGDGTTNAVAFTVGTSTVADLVTAINNVDGDITASFNTSTNQIDITSGTGGAVLTFAESGSALSDFAFNDGTAEVTAGAVTYATTQAATDTLIAAFGADATDVLTVSYNGLDTILSIGNQSIQELVDSITAIDADITASYNTTSNQIDITSGAGGAAVTFTETTGDPLTELAFNNGTSAVVTATAETFATTATGSDLVTSAYGASATDVLRVALTGGGTADITVGTLTIDELVAAIADVDSAVEASFNTSTKAIDISTATGNQITFTDITGSAVSSLTLAGSDSSTVTSGDAVAFTDTTVAVTTGDLLTTAFSGVLATDVLTVSTSNGGTTSFTVGTQTVADLVAAIGNSDSALTASFNSTSAAIEISASTGTAVTFTNTIGSAVGNLGLTDGTSALTSGSAVTYGSSGSASEVGTLNADFQSILEQIDTLLDDATYKGTNLLKGSNDFEVKFNADGSSSLTLAGLDLGVTGNTELKFTLDASGYDFTGTGIDTALADTQNAIDHLRSVASTFGTGLGIIQTREEFTSELVNVLQSGSDKLINANLEEESANLLALQTRQSLGIQSLSIANQSQQSILSLFR